MPTTLALSFVLLAGAAPIAQTPAGSAPQAPPTIGAARSLNQSYATIKRYILASAEKMAEAEFAFKPTPDVRSFGQILGHIANAGYGSCRVVLAEANPNTRNLEEAADKAGALESLKAMFAYCDKAFDGITEDNVVQFLEVPVNVRSASGEVVRTTQRVARISPAMTLVSHLNEHYGNLVTYMRLKGVVPPSSEPARR